MIKEYATLGYRDGRLVMVRVGHCFWMCDTKPDRKLDVEITDEDGMGWFSQSEYIPCSKGVVERCDAKIAELRKMYDASC